MAPHLPPSPPSDDDAEQQTHQSVARLTSLINELSTTLSHFTHSTTSPMAHNPTSNTPSNFTNTNTIAFATSAQILERAINQLTSRINEEAHEVATNALLSLKPSMDFQENERKERFLREELGRIRGENVRLSGARNDNVFVGVRGKGRFALGKGKGGGGADVGEKGKGEGEGKRVWEGKETAGGETVTLRRCGGCGQVGHVRTNKKVCPAFVATIERE